MKLIEFPVSFFTVVDGVNGNKTFVAEASDMENRHLQPLGNDSLHNHFGFAIRFNKKTVVKYRMSSVGRDGEGELTYWKYEACYEDVLRYPEEAMFTHAKIFND